MKKVAINRNELYFDAVYRAIRYCVGDGKKEIDTENAVGNGA